jgi:hypothetical protein
MTGGFDLIVGQGEARECSHHLELRQPQERCQSS